MLINSCNDLDINKSQNQVLRLIVPVALSLLILIWTYFISPYAQYDDNWATYPVFAIALFVIGWHLYLLIKPGTVSRAIIIIYAVIHIPILANISMFSLMLIAKESI